MHLRNARGSLEMRRPPAWRTVSGRRRRRPLRPAAYAILIPSTHAVLESRCTDAAEASCRAWSRGRRGIMQAGQAVGQSTPERPSNAERDAQERMRESRRKWYAGHQEHAKAKVVERRRDLQRFLVDLKSSYACQECGERHPACLDFYPRAGHEHLESSHDMVRNGWSKERITTAIANCDVLCANCHSKREWRDLALPINNQDHRASLPASLLP